MAASYLNEILNYIGEHNPMHYKKLKKTINFDDEEYVNRAETFFKNYTEILNKESKNLPFALDCYLRFCADTMVEQIKFLETGVYSNTSFNDVNERIYNNPEIMSYHMHGLLVSQYLWVHHYKTLQFFFNNIDKFSANVHHVLEVGGGHGLYTNEIINHFNSGLTYTMVDISETSIEMSKSFVKSNKVEYLHEDIYKFKGTSKFDFIIMGEVLEHVEDPTSLMEKLYSLGTDNATAFITTPCNAPTIDHIYLFRNAEEVRALLNRAGWEVTLDQIASSEGKNGVTADSLSIPTLYAAFLKKRV